MQVALEETALVHSGGLMPLAERRCHLSYLMLHLVYFYLPRPPPMVPLPNL
jgi:hypothetical protein